ncbi:MULTISPECIES: hypothetical protein [Aminobacter]|uniref:hypothetical protein n=1 Tax=Aminobacter TaxID=31988 RepID=UPI000D3E2C01|nr:MULTISPECIES: hypothetical protein [Aminobacter]
MFDGSRQLSNIACLLYIRAARSPQFQDFASDFLQAFHEEIVFAENLIAGETMNMSGRPGLSHAVENGPVLGSHDARA